ncbi:uncharacterized protein TNCV_2208331 [Trichonephila clavipes]|nr:uncharacterized protein TNCV_2208331 [Trichonephila clavipes]
MYRNVNRRRPVCRASDPPASTSKAELHPKMLLSVWWDMRKINLLCSATQPNSQCCLQLDGLHSYLGAKRPGLINRHGVILHQDSVRPLAAFITCQKLRDFVYSALVANLDAETLSYVSDIVLSPPNSDKYHTLSQQLITQFSDSETQKIKKLLTDLQLGDEKPSHLLRKMKELSNGQLQDDFLQSLWLQRMPPHIQTVLSASSEPLDKLAIIADKVSEVVGASSTICAATNVPPPSQSSSCSAQPTMDSLARQIQELSLQVAELTR